MKKIILSTVLMAILLVGCNQKSKQEESVNSNEIENVSQLYSCPMHPEVTGKKGDTCSKCGMELSLPVKQAEVSEEKEITQTIEANVEATTFSISEIVSNYLTLKNALVKDDSKGAASAGKKLYATFNSIKSSTVDAKLQKDYLEIAGDAKEHAEHIGDNAGKIDHQREHFVMLSKDVSDLIKTFGTNQKLYQDFCPMADEGKGALWISEIKEIKNPYYGSNMLNCGSVKKQFN